MAKQSIINGFSIDDFDLEADEKHYSYTAWNNKQKSKRKTRLHNTTHFIAKFIVIMYGIIVLFWVLSALMFGKIIFHIPEAFTAIVSAVIGFYFGQSHNFNEDK